MRGQSSGAVAPLSSWARPRRNRASARAQAAADDGRCFGNDEGRDDELEIGLLQHAPAALVVLVVGVGYGVEGAGINDGEHATPPPGGCLRSFVARFPDGGRGLTLAGPPGTGRTHLGAAITRALVERDVHALMFNVPAFFRSDRQQLRAAPERFDAVLDLLCRCDHLLLDDLGREQPTAWTRETLYLVVNARYEAGRATSVVTNLDLDALAAHTGAAIADRLRDTNTAYWCEWASYRWRSRAEG